MSGRTRRRKGKVTASPKAKRTTTRTRPDLRQRKLGDFGIKRQRVEFVGDVQENDDFETPRLDRAAYVFCDHKSARVL